MDGNLSKNVLNCHIPKRPYLKIINFRRVHNTVVKVSLLVIFRPPVSLLLCLQGTVKIQPNQFSRIALICDFYYSVSIHYNSGKYV
jgi:hypothetical protein